MSTYEARRSLIFNYINPIIGDVKLSDLNTRMMEKYYQNLLKVKSRVVNNRKPNTEYLSCHVVREVHKLLRSAFNQAVKWELMAKNPCVNATLPQEEHKARDIWDAPTLFKALELCDDDILRLAINLAFSCSLRVGEMLGLTWDCVEISDASITNGTAFIFVNKELQRVNRDALEKLNEKGIILKFPAFFARTNTALVLKEPKTKTSTRKVFLPKTVAEMLKERYQEIQEYKQTSRSPENKLQEVYISNPNYNNSSYNNISDNESYPIQSEENRFDNDNKAYIQAYEELVKENIDYESLLISHPVQKDLIQGIYEMILETVLCQNEKILIASNWYPAELVKSKFLKLNHSHIEYVLECFRRNTTKVKNIKKYMLAALFNAPSTIDGYYTAEVNHDMPWLA